LVFHQPFRLPRFRPPFLSRFLAGMVSQGIFIPLKTVFTQSFNSLSMDKKTKNTSYAMLIQGSIKNFFNKP